MLISLPTLASLVSGCVLWFGLSPGPQASIPLQTNGEGTLRFHHPFSLNGLSAIDSRWITVITANTNPSDYVEVWKTTEPTRITFVDPVTKLSVTHPDFRSPDEASDVEAATTAVRIPIGFDRSGRFMVEFHREAPDAHNLFDYRCRVPEHIEWFNPNNNQSGVIPIPKLVGASNDRRTIGYWTTADRTAVAQLKFDDSGPSELFIFDLASKSLRSKCSLELSRVGWTGLSDFLVSPDLTQLIVPAEVETDLELTILSLSLYDTHDGALIETVSTKVLKNRLAQQLRSRFPQDRAAWLADLELGEFTAMRQENAKERVGGLTTTSDCAYILVNPKGPNSHIEVWTRPPRRPVVASGLITMGITIGTWIILRYRAKRRMAA